MQQINLSWDLFILAFFGVVTAYSFIIGRSQTLKIITSTYVAILCSDALGNLFAVHLATSEPFLRFMRLFAVGDADQATAFFKVLVLIAIVVVVAVRGLFDFDVTDDQPLTIRLGITLILGVLSAGLMISAILIFTSGNSLVANMVMEPNALTQIYSQSRMVRILLDFRNMWFFLPGLAMILLSLFQKKTS